MNINRILVATDFSPDSEAALEFASSLASAEKAALVIVHIDDTTPGLVFGDVGYGFVPEVDAIAREEYHHLLATAPKCTGVPFEHRFLRGCAAESILYLAEAEHVDLIVIGTHGKTGLSRLLMGSVAEALMRRAKCPVLTVKQPAERNKPSATATKHEASRT